MVEMSSPQQIHFYVSNVLQCAAVLGNYLFSLFRKMKLYMSDLFLKILGTKVSQSVPPLPQTLARFMTPSAYAPPPFDN